MSVQRDLETISGPCMLELVQIHWGYGFFLLTTLYILNSAITTVMV
jgi:hypothetical protein